MGENQSRTRTYGNTIFSKYNYRGGNTSRSFTSKIGRNRNYWWNKNCK